MHENKEIARNRTLSRPTGPKDVLTMLAMA